MTQLSQKSPSLHLFSSLPNLPEDPVYGFQQTIKSDPRRDKLNLTIGIIPPPTGKRTNFSSVQEAANLVGMPFQTYLPLSGNQKTNSSISALLFEEQMLFASQKECVTIQTLGGTGAVHMLLSLFKQAGIRHVATVVPTWINHPKIIENLGLKFIDLPNYETTELKKLPPDTLVLLQPTCHNPLGSRLSQEGLHTIFKAAECMRLPLLFDIAYLGFGHSVHRDTEAVRMALEYDVILGIALSGSKSFGLYNSRIGWASLLTKRESADKVLRNFEFCARTHYSSPPAYGAEIVEKLLTSPPLRKKWEEELKGVSEKLTLLRMRLYHKIHSKYTLEPTGEGLFMLLPLTAFEIEELHKRFAIYVGQEGMMSGRINLAAIEDKDIERVAFALNEVRRL